MKKFLLSLAVLFAGVVSAQQYKVGDLCYALDEAEEFLMSTDDMGTKFLTQDSWNYVTTAPNDSAKVAFEATGEQTDEGFDLYVLKFVATGEYVKDQTLPKGFDGSDVALSKKPYIFTTANIEEAAKWTVLPAETRYKVDFEEDGYMENWRVWTGVGTGTDTEEDVANGIQNKMVYDGAFVLMNAHLVKEGNAPTYFEWHSPSGTDETYAMFAEWGSNSWFLWTAEEMSDMEILELFVTQNLPNGVGGAFVKGDCPGQYDPATVEAVEAVYARYEAAYLGESDEDPAVILADFKEAIKNLKVNVMREGYYYIQPNRQVPPGSGKAGLIFDEGGAIRAQEFARPEVLTVEASRYIWYFKPATETDILEAYAEPKENAYYIQNYGTSKWATNVVADLTGNGEKTFTTGDNAAVYVFEYLTVIPGTVYIYTHQSKGKCTGEDGCPYCAAWNLQNHGKHWILKWNARWDEGNMMFLYPVAQEEVDAIRDQVVQYDINQRLQAVVEAAKLDYSKGITYKAVGNITNDDQFADHGLIYYQVDSVADETGVNQAVVNTNLAVVDANGNNAVHPSDGAALPGLFDNDRSTFMHTYWSGTTYPHYFDITLTEDQALDAIAVKFMRRFGTSEHNGSFTPKELAVYARKDTADEWKAQGTLVVTYDIPLMDYDSAGVATGVNQSNGFAHNNFVGIGAMGLDDTYRYIRLANSKTNNNTANTYMSVGEMGVYNAEYAPELSINGAISDEIKNALIAELEKAEAELAAGKGTEAQIVALQEAYDAYLAVYPDPTRLKDAVAAAKAVSEALPTATDSLGDKGAGWYSLESVEAFNGIVATIDATVAPVMPLETINSGIETLETATATLLKSMSMPEKGTYVRVRSLTSTAAYNQGIVYLRGADDKRGIVPGFVAQVSQEIEVEDPETGEMVTETVKVDNETYKGSISAAWYIEDVKENTVAIRNVGSGLYLQANVPVNNQLAVLSTEKAYVPLQVDGNKYGGKFNFMVGQDTVSKKTLFMNTAGSGNLCGWHSAAGNDNSTFGFETIELADFEDGRYSIQVSANAKGVFTLPVDVKYSEADVIILELAGFVEADQKVYFTPVEDGSIIKAGTAMLVVNTLNEVAQLNFWQENGAISSIDDLTFGYESVDKNGFVGLVFGANIPENYGYLHATGQIAVTENTISNGETVETRFQPFSAYINGKNIPVLEENPGVEEGDVTTGVAYTLEKLELINAIENVQVEAVAGKAGVYTISGVRLNSTKNLPAGLYIIDGKKVIK